MSAKPSRLLLRRACPTAVLTLALVAGCSGPDPAQRLARATEQYDAGRHREAVIELQNLVQIEPQNLRAQVLLGNVWLALGNFEAARQSLTAARELGATVEEYGLALAITLIRLARLAEAKTELERIPPPGRGARWHAAHGELQLADNRLQAADAAFQEALALDAELYDAWLGRARAAARSADWSRVFEHADSAVALDAGRYEGYLARGDAQLRAGNVAAAELDFQRAAEILQQSEPSAVEAGVLVALAQAQLTLNRADALRTTAERTRARIPDSTVATYIEGLADFAAGRYREATAKLQQASSSGTSSDSLLPLLLGLAHLELGNLGQAESHLLNALERRAGDPAAVRALADARRKQGRHEAALEALDRAADADDPAILSARAVLYLETQQPELAVITLQRVRVATADVDVGVKLLLARAYLETGRVQDAAALFDTGFGDAAQPALEIVTRLLANVAGNTGLDEARASARRLVEERPDDVQVLFGVALFHQAVGANEDALDLLRRGAERDPTFVAPRLAMAALALAAGETERARDHYEWVVETAPAEHRGWLGLAQLAVADGDADEARRFAQRAADAAPQELAPRLLLAHLALASGDPSRADEPLAAARAIDPDQPDVATLTARLALAQQRVDVALSELERAANADRGNVERWHRLGTLQLAVGAFSAARVSLQRAVTLAPRNARARFQLGQAEAALGNSGVARLVARELQADFPDQDLGYVLEGELLAVAADHRAAARLFERAYDQRPAFEHAARASAARQQAGINDSSAPLERWLARTPDDARAWLLVGQAREIADRPSDALTAYEKVISLEPDNVIALNNAAWIHNQAGSPLALTYAERAAAVAPETAQVLDTYGWVLLTRGDVEGAVAQLRKAALGAADAPDIQYHFAAALAREGDTVEARRVLEAILSTSRDFTSREQAQALLAEL